MKKDLAKVHAKKVGQTELPQVLADIPFNSLTPILVEAMRQKAEKIGPRDLLREAEVKSEFFGPSAISQKELCRFQQLFFEGMPDDFESIQLPPIAPLGICSAVTKLGQNERLTTIRKSEVISDSTLTLAVQAAIRRKQQCVSPEGVYADVSFATFHRLLRLQKFDPEKKWSQHFEILGTITTGRRKGKNSFRNDTIRKHVQMWIDFFARLNQGDYAYRDILFTFSSVALMEWILEAYGVCREEVNQNSLKGGYDYFEAYRIPIPRQITTVREIQDMIPDGLYKQLLRFEQEVLEPLRSTNPHISFCYEMDRKLGLGYFNGVCFHGFATNLQGERFDLIDGGSSDWVGQMLSDKHEVTITSSFGVEVGIAQFRKM